MRRVSFILIFLFVFSMTLTSASALRIVEFCPDTYLPRDADAYLVLEGTGSLGNVTISDGEGSIAFPAWAGIAGRITVADEAVAYKATHGVLPDFEVKNTSATVPDMIKSGRYAPANEKDELVLSAQGVAVQSIRWPGDLHPREGQVHFLSGSGWDPRILLLGQSRFGTRTFTNATVTVFVSPDSSYSVLESAISGAQREILVNAYELSHPGIGELLAAAHSRGVSILVLLEGGPVGGISPDEEAVCAALNRTGVPLLSMTTTSAAHARYRYDHAKYLVIDGEDLLISTENFGLHGYPPPGSRGNRGWGALIEDPEVAGYFRGVFSADTHGGDVVPFLPSPGEPSTPSLVSYQAEFPPLRVTGVGVTPILSPDTSDEIPSLLARARQRIEIEQASVRNASGDRPDPFLAAAVTASRRGVAVRILLDGSRFNDEGPADNNEIVDFVNTLARQENLPLSARVLDPGPANLESVHTKGVIVDGRAVMISSINWNGNSPNFNREAGVILEDPSLGNYFSSVFDADWNRAGNGGGTGGPDTAKLALAGLVIVILLLFFLRKRR
ncbi:MAG TPA: phospholipase D-like domain-containing protein [Methanomicrobiales archaeon]|nr:phospholipase D-like domain-containing protein [Methanomicrobiales archaeon]